MCSWWYIIGNETAFAFICCQSIRCNLTTRRSNKSHSLRTAIGLNWIYFERPPLEYEKQNHDNGKFGLLRAKCCSSSNNKRNKRTFNALSKFKEIESMQIAANVLCVEKRRKWKRKKKNKFANFKFCNITKIKSWEKNACPFFCSLTLSIICLILIFAYLIRCSSSFLANHSQNVFFGIGWYSIVGTVGVPI